MARFLLVEWTLLFISLTFIAPPVAASVCTQQPYAKFQPLVGYDPAKKWCEGSLDPGPSPSPCPPTKPVCVLLPVLKTLSKDVAKAVCACIGYSPSASSTRKSSTTSTSAASTTWQASQVSSSRFLGSLPGSRSSQTPNPVSSSSSTIHAVITPSALSSADQPTYIFSGSSFVFPPDPSDSSNTSPSLSPSASSSISSVPRPTCTQLNPPPVGKTCDRFGYYVGPACPKPPRSTTPGVTPTILLGDDPRYDFAGFYPLPANGRPISDGPSTTSAHMTQEFCARFCNEPDETSSVFAISGGTTCTCKAQVPSTEPKHSPAVSIPCAGNVAKSCGSPGYAIYYARARSDQGQIAFSCNRPTAEYISYGYSGDRGPLRDSFETCAASCRAQPGCQAFDVLFIEDASNTPVCSLYDRPVAQFEYQPVIENPNGAADNQEFFDLDCFKCTGP